VSSLEKKLAEEKKQRADFQLKLETERKNKKVEVAFKHFFKAELWIRDSESGSRGKKKKKITGKTYRTRYSLVIVLLSIKFFCSLFDIYRCF
jgi:hypothetical protein